MPGSISKSSRLWREGDPYTEGSETAKVGTDPDTLRYGAGEQPRRDAYGKTG